MVDHTGWYPPGQVCYPPQLPAYLQEVYDLKPVVGAPIDDEIIGIHAVIHAAHRVSVVPGMNSPTLLMNLADHLFGVQMARYRSRHSLITFPSDATYTPPTLPAHVSITLVPVIGAPTDEEIINVQDALQTYRELRRFPAMFDAHINMQLSQHLFDLQMARHMRIASESQPNPVSHPATSSQLVGQAPHLTGEMSSATNNVGTGAHAASVHQPPQLTAPVINAHELMEQSNRLAERLSHLLERSNELAERSNPPAEESNNLSDRFNQVLERFTRVIEQYHQPLGSGQLAERLDQFFDRFTQVVERPLQRTDQPAGYSDQTTRHPNQLMDSPAQSAEHSSNYAERFNELFERLNQHLEQSGHVAEELTKPVEKLGDVLKNINKVLVGIQHAIVRNHKGNSASALDCLVNEKGETPIESGVTSNWSLKKVFSSGYRQGENTRIHISGAPQQLFIPNVWLGIMLCFYGISGGLCEGTSTRLIVGREDAARKRLADYWSSSLG